MLHQWLTWIEGWFRMSITQKYMKKVNAFDLIYFRGTNIILLCNIYVYKYIPLRNSFCESSSADLLTLQLFLKIHLYFTDAQPQPSHFVDSWPKTNSSRSKSSPLRQSNILCSINIFHYFCVRFFQNYFNRYFLWPRQLSHAKRDQSCFSQFSVSDTFVIRHICTLYIFAKFNWVFQKKVWHLCPVMQ